MEFFLTEICSEKYFYELKSKATEIPKVFGGFHIPKKKKNNLLRPGYGSTTLVIRRAYKKLKGHEMVRKWWGSRREIRRGKKVEKLRGNGLGLRRETG
jgi:hypothetical protein